MFARECWKRERVKKKERKKERENKQGILCYCYRLEVLLKIEHYEHILKMQSAIQFLRRVV